MSLVIAHDDATFGREVAQYILQIALGAVEAGGRFTWAVSGGTTPKRVFEILAQDYFKTRMPWAKTYLFWVDERCVPPTHADSNYGMTKTALLSKVPLAESHIFRMPGETLPPHTAAKAYENSLRTFFKLEKSVPKLDLVLLGIGEDGHTASLFPGTVAVQEKERWVVSNFIEKLSSNRLTLTTPVLNQAEHVVFLVNGAGKATIMRDIFRTDIPVNRYPAQLIQPASGNLVWFLDLASAAKLPASVQEIAKHI